eukprot:jgi/Mesvir1/6959/Mv09106-RA.1
MADKVEASIGETEEAAVKEFLKELRAEAARKAALLKTQMPPPPPKEEVQRAGEVGLPRQGDNSGKPLSPGSRGASEADRKAAEESQRRVDALNLKRWTGAIMKEMRVPGADSRVPATHLLQEVAVWAEREY